MNGKCNNRNLRNRPITAIIATTLLMFITEWRMALPVTGEAMIGLILIGIGAGRARRHTQTQQETLGHLKQYTEEVYEGLDVVRLSRASRQVKENFREWNGAVYSSSHRGQFSENLRLIFISFMGTLLLVTVWISGIWLAQTGAIGAGDIAAFMLYVGALTLSLKSMVKRK